MADTSSPAPSFIPGDVVPGISMPGRDGALVDLSHQSMAGTCLALWLTDASVTRSDLDEAERRLDQFETCEAHLIHVAVAATPHSVAAPKGALKQLFDPQGQMGPLFGLAGGGIILLDRNRRLAGIYPGEGAKQALAHVRALHAKEPEGRVLAQAPVLLIPGIFSADEAHALVAYWNAGEKDVVNAVATAGGDSLYDGRQIKRRTDITVKDRALFNLVKTRIERRVFPEILKAFQCAIDRMELPRIGCYDAADKGEFGRHRDNTTPFTAHRKFALSINLNSGYEGGAVNFPEYGRQIYKPGIGGGVAFSCSLLHEAQPVTKGKRFGIFTFFTDEEGGRREDEMRAKYAGQYKTFSLTES